MKRMIIGSVLFISGILIVLSILITSTMLHDTVANWSSSRLLKVVSVYELKLPFAFGIIFTIIGLLILIIEYCRKGN